MKKLEVLKKMQLCIQREGEHRFRSAFNFVRPKIDQTLNRTSARELQASASPTLRRCYRAWSRDPGLSLAWAWYPESPRRQLCGCCSRRPTQHPRSLSQPRTSVAIWCRTGRKIWRCAGIKDRCLLVRCASGVTWLWLYCCPFYQVCWERGACC